MPSKITIYRGDTLPINLAFKGVNLTGASVFLTVKSTVDNDLTDSSAVITKKVTVHSNPTIGETIINVSAAETNVVPPGIYGYDIQIVTSTGDVSTAEVGQFIVKGEYTRRTV